MSATRCAHVGALMVGGHVVGQLRCELEDGHDIFTIWRGGERNGERLTPTPHRAVLEWNVGEIDPELFNPDEHFDVDVPFPTPECGCGGDFPLNSWPGSEYGGHWDTCPARVKS